MAQRKHILKSVPPEKLEQIENLRYAVKRCEDKGLFDTAHHTMLARLEAELGLIPNKKDMRDEHNEVTDGEPDL